MQKDIPKNHFFWVNDSRDITSERFIVDVTSYTAYFSGTKHASVFPSPIYRKRSVSTSSSKSGGFLFLWCRRVSPLGHDRGSLATSEKLWASSWFPLLPDLVEHNTRVFGFVLILRREHLFPNQFVLQSKGISHSARIINTSPASVNSDTFDFELHGWISAGVFFSR